jgi:hypothetical protein
MNRLLSRSVSREMSQHISPLPTVGEGLGVRGLCLRGASLLLLLLLTISPYAEPPSDTMLSTLTTQMGLADNPNLTLVSSPASGESSRFVFILDRGQADSGNIFIHAYEAHQIEGTTRFTRIDATPDIPGVQGFRLETSDVQTLEIETTDSGNHRLRLIPAPGRAAGTASQHVLFTPECIGRSSPFSIE